MATPWIDSIKRTGRLAINLEPLPTGWREVFEDAVAVFNRLSRQHGCGVQFERVRNRPGRPAASANVDVMTGNGNVTIEFGGMTYPVTVEGSSLHGREFSLKSANGSGLEYACIVVPSQPLVTNGLTGVVREAGRPIKLVIAVHELVHACGLGGDDHSPRGVFQAYPRATVETTPSGDWIDSGEYRNNLPVHMPPVILDDATVNKIKSVWQ